MEKIMAKITSKAISSIKNKEELIEFLALNIFEKENAGALEDSDIPDFIKNVICIIQFETEIEMQGDFQNYYFSGYNCERFVNAFKQTGNNELANYIGNFIELYKLYETDLTDDFETKSEPLAKEIGRIIDEKIFWGNVEKYIEVNMI